MNEQQTRHTRLLRAGQVAGRLALAVLIFLVGDLIFYRPAQLRWGATDEEVSQAMPGDAVQPHPAFNATRAVTIAAPPEHVWPWLVQIGEGRAGWYGYDLFDNDGVPSTDHILPQWQAVQVGQDLPISSIARMTLVAFEPNRYLLWQGGDKSTYVMTLYPDPGAEAMSGRAKTRLVWRIHMAPYDWGSWLIGPQLFADTVDVIAVRQILTGIRARAEGGPLPDPTAIYAELGLWIAAFMGFVVAEAGVVVRRDWVRPLLAAPVSGFITIGVILLRPALAVDGLAVLGMFAALWWTYRRPFVHQASLESRSGNLRLGSAH